MVQPVGGVILCNEGIMDWKGYMHTGRTCMCIRMKEESFSRMDGTPTDNVQRSVFIDLATHP